MAKKYKLMPEEIYGEKNCRADDGTLVKVLFYALYAKQDFQQELVLLALITVMIGLHTHLRPCCFNLLESQRKPVSHSSRPSRI